MNRVTCVEDLRRVARRRVPRWIFDYAASGSYDELTMQANRRDLDAIPLRQRVLVDVGHRSQETSIVGQPARRPLAIAPTGLAGFFHPDGEIHGARAAQAAGIPFCLSTVSICSIEDLRAATNHPFWFQVYVMKDRGFTRSLIERARAAQCSALVITLDLPLQAQRHNDIRNGLTVPPRMTLANLVQMALHPRWSLGILRAGRFNFGNFRGAFEGSDSMTTFAQWAADSFDASLTWDDLAFIRDAWPGTLILKGILDPEDASRAVAAGADAIVVSNHGGRQLDSAPSSISMLPRIVDVVGGRAEVLFDGGVRSGQDVLKAIALGARACLIGKSFLYGLAAGGQAGVLQAIELIGRELDVSMALTGCSDVTRADGSLLAS